MLNKIWPGMVIISVIFGILNGRISEVNDAIFISLEDTVSMCLNFIGIMCFWNGITKILTKTKVLDFLKKILRPVIKLIFGDLEKNAKDFVILNMVSNILGIGNAATPVGIKAMHELDKKCSGEKMSYEMNMFILLNTLSIQIIPTTIISIRSSLGSESPGKIIVPVWIVSIITFISIIFIGMRVFKKENV